MTPLVGNVVVALKPVHWIELGARRGITDVTSGLVLYGETNMASKQLMIGERARLAGSGERSGTTKKAVAGELYPVQRTLLGWMLTDIWQGD